MKKKKEDPDPETVADNLTPEQLEAQNQANKEKEGEKTPEDKEEKKTSAFSKMSEDDIKSLVEQNSQFKKDEEARQAKLDADAQQKAIDEGKFEGLIKDKDSKIESYEKKESVRKEREEKVKVANEKKIEDLKKTCSPDQWSDVEYFLSNSDDPFDVSQSISKIEKILGTGKAQKKGGSDIPSGTNTSRLTELEQKLDDGEKLTRQEEKEFKELNRSQK